MNTENLNLKELETLRTLLNKMAGVPTPKVYLDPVNKMIDDIMDEFNFARVQNVMDYLDWKWAGEYVTIEMLKETARRLLREAADLRLGDYKDTHWEQGVICATGGFQAMAWCNEDKTEVDALDLKFVLADWDAQIEN